MKTLLENLELFAVETLDLVLESFLQIHAHTTRHEGVSLGKVMQNTGFSTSETLLDLKIVIWWRVNAFTPSYTITTFNNPEERALWKHYGKKRKCW